MRELSPGSFSGFCEMMTERLRSHVESSVSKGRQQWLDRTRRHCGQKMECTKSEGFDVDGLEWVREEWTCPCGYKQTIQGRSHTM